MRLLLVALVAGLAAIGAMVAAGEDSEGPYRVDAIFDTAKGIVPGHLVKIAGVRVGRVQDVRLTPDHQARLVLEIDREFEPFRADARCDIRPEGLISENFVACRPGTSAQPLGTAGGDVPTVAVERTSAPVDLQDVINVFSLPVSERAAALVDELGLATAGRGADLDAILRRANPALSDAERVLGILAGQRKAIAEAITQTDGVLRQVSARREDLRDFVARADDVVSETAEHAEPLAAAVRDLPPMFTAVDRGLGALRRISAAGTPLMRDLRAAAPGLRSFTEDIVPFARAGLPAVKRLGGVAGPGARHVRDARRLFNPASRLVRELGPASRQLALLFDSLTEQGGVEAVMRFFYQMAAMSGGYDSTSHYVAVVINLLIPCLLDLDRVGCSQAYSAPGNGTIPANAPSLGPQRLYTVVEDEGAVIDNAEAARMARRDPEAIERLLRYLLQ